MKFACINILFTIKINNDILKLFNNRYRKLHKIRILTINSIN